MTSVGGAVSASGITGTNTSEDASSGWVWSESIVATLVSGWASSLAPLRTSALYVTEPFSVTLAAVQDRVRVVES